MKAIMLLYNFLFLHMLSTTCNAFVQPPSPLRSPSLFHNRDNELRRLPLTLSLETKPNGVSESEQFLQLPKPSTTTSATTTTTTTTSPEDNERTTIKTTTTPSSSSIRRIDSIERFARLPVWPVWNGVIIFLVSRLFGNGVAAKLEDAFGGRVCPNFFPSSPDKTSPFIMLVHHRHSFAAWDPLRYLQRTFFPEGFPSHPHRGFITLTYFLRCGFLHRDSLGIKQTYGAEDRHNGKHTQYLMTGAGLLHEEMFDIQADNAFGVSGQELYQLWLNVPAANKLDKPFVQLLGGPEETPTVVMVDDNNRDNTNGCLVETVVLAGEYQNKKSSARLLSDVSIFHVKMMKGGSWKYNLPPNHATALLYIRTGSVTIDGENIGPHNTVYFGLFGEELVVESNNNQEMVDFLFLSGEPLNEPVAAQGSMVMNNAYEINNAYTDYQNLKMGAPWDHKISDREWKDHVDKFPSIYR